MAGWHVTTNDIKNWTATQKRQSEEVLPQLVDRLIRNSCRWKNIDFPYGDSIAFDGWDGMLEVNKGTNYIPSGKSGWEIGTDSNVKGKADREYSNRLINHKPLKLKETTFVFVTSRLWTNRDKWVQSKKKENKWKDVKGINASSLELWLKICPPTHRWFAQKLGKRSAFTWDIEQAWNEYSNQTKIKISSDFLLHGRETESKIFADIVEGQPEVYRIKSLSKIEAYGFILASISNSDFANPRALIILNQEAWNLMAASENPLILIPHGFSPTGLGLARSRGHIVIIAVDDQDSNFESITLNRQNRLIRQKGLTKLGFDNMEAEHLYNATKGYLEPLLRHNLLQPIDSNSPQWLNNISPEVLFATLFASEWNEDFESDKKAMEILSGIHYSKFEKTIIKLSKVNDPPIRLVGNVWQVISKIDFWYLIAPKIAVPYLNCLGKAIITVLADTDPSYDLPREKRYLAPLENITPKYSKRLRRGLSDSLAMLAVFGDKYSSQIGEKIPSSFVSSWVETLFNKNNDIKFWYSLNNCMPFLAEAAPAAFISAVEFALLGKQPILLELFEKNDNAFFGGLDHTNLLWSLELVSWNKQYFSQVSLHLARLVEIDPGGGRSNRPLNSLTDLYLGWYNNSSITHKERIQILDELLFPNYSDVAWKLAISLLKSKTSTTSGISKPKYREWSKNIDSRAHRNAYNDYVGSVVEILIREVEKNPEIRFCDLIENFDSYSNEQQKSIIDKLLNQTVSEMGGKSREVFLTKLRDTLSHHREYPNAILSWPSELLNKLEKVYHHFDYSDSIRSNLFLFNDQWPPLINPIIKKSNYEERELHILHLRKKIIESIYNKQGLETLTQLINESSRPDIVGQCSYKSSISEKLLDQVIEWLGDGGALGDFAVSYLTFFVHENLSRAESILKNKTRMKVKIKVRFLLCFPLNKKTLSIVDSLSKIGRSKFWSDLKNYRVYGKDVQLPSIVSSKLLDNNRPVAALNAIAIVINSVDENQLDVDLIESILLKIATDPRDIKNEHMHDFSFNISQAIEFLQDSSTVNIVNIQHIEWAFIELLKSERISPRYLSNLVANNSEYFAQLVIWTWERNDGINEKDEKLSKEFIQLRGKKARKLLNSITILPGSKGDTIDHDILKKWIESVRNILKGVGRLEIGDDQIGVFLSKCMAGSDSIWPHESVRKIIERLKNDSIDNAIIVEKRNSRGITVRHPYAGGEQEHKLANDFSIDAENIQLIWPRTAKILRSIAESYKSDANREDDQVDLRY
jgi:hypothetical protein